MRATTTAAMIQNTVWSFIAVDRGTFDETTKKLEKLFYFHFLSLLTEVKIQESRRVIRKSR